MNSSLREEVEQFLFLEARLLDQAKIPDWHKLFTDDCLYWIPIDETRSPEECVSIVNDNAIALEERIYHLLSTTFAAQTPKSRTLHFISNITASPASDGQAIQVESNQMICELRTGDYSQVGLGEIQTLLASVSYELARTGDGLRIRKKIIRLLNRDMPQGNLTFLL